MLKKEIHIFSKRGCTGCTELTPKLRKLAKKHKLKFFEWDLDTVDGMPEGAFIGVRSDKPLPQVFITTLDDKANEGCRVLFNSNKVEYADLLEKLTTFLEGAE